MVCVSVGRSRVKLVLQVLERLQTGFSCCSRRHCNCRAMLKGVEILCPEGTGSCQAAGGRGECPLPCCLAVLQGECADWLSGCHTGLLNIPRKSLREYLSCWGLKALVDFKAESRNEAFGDRKSGQDNG